MSFRTFLHAWSLFGAVLYALALTLLVEPQPAMAEQAQADKSATHADHEHHHDAHKNHEVAPGFQRSLASYSVPAVTMINQDGQRVALQELLNADMPVMLNFIFTSCTAICPAMSAIFASVQDELGSDSGRLRMVSISIDPEHDTPEALSAYATRFGAGPQWEFLTGSLDDSIAVQRAFDADRGDKMNHAPMTLFRASPESQWVRYEGFATAADLAKEYRDTLARNGDAPAEMHNARSRAGYSAGHAFGSQLARLQTGQSGVDLESLFRGILDALAGTAPRLSEAEMRAALQELERNATAGKPEAGTAPQQQMRARYRGYKDDFAALNALREGVVILPSGVQYEVLKPGSGSQPDAAGAVLVSYQGTLTNGAVFDTTYEEGKPVRLQLEEIVVPGLKEALLLMKQGAQWRVVIPPNMGFKRAGNNQLRRRDLIYEIELVAVEAAPATASAPAAAQP